LLLANNPAAEAHFQFQTLPNNKILTAKKIIAYRVATL